MSPAQAPIVMTTLEATVHENRWAGLRAAFADATAQPEPGLVETYLIQSRSDSTLWRIVTLWRDAAALEAMRAAGPPRGPLMFRAAGADPSLMVAEVAGHHRQDG